MARRAGAGDNAPTDAVHFAALINHHPTASMHSFAYSFSEIDRSPNLWPALASLTGIKKCCEFQFTIVNKDGSETYTPGVMRGREVSGQGPWETFVMAQKMQIVDNQRLCIKCTNHAQRPMYHTHKRDCKRSAVNKRRTEQRALLHPRKEIINPSVSRLNGKQLGGLAKKKKKMSKGDAQVAAMLKLRNAGLRKTLRDEYGRSRLPNGTLVTKALQKDMQEFLKELIYFELGSGKHQVRNPLHIAPGT
jgi:hypothetical protein